MGLVLCDRYGNRLFGNQFHQFAGGQPEPGFAHGGQSAEHAGLVAAPARGILLAWNCRHLANVQILRRLEAEAKRVGWKLPKVCTPPELMGDSTYETESDS
jgi:hypothetical protein